MLVNLQNNYLQVGINTKGAELVSVKNNDDLEYIWNGNPKFWKRHAPILFPIVGRLQNDEYNYDGTVYKMYQHGFARDSEFEIVDQTNKRLKLLLQPNSKIKQHYPFKFKLYVVYELVENELKITMLVKNEDKHSMYFSIGSHPGFNIPLGKNGGDFDDYEVTISPNKEYSLVALDKEGLTTELGSEHDEIDNPVKINHELFKKDAKIFDVSKNKQTTFKIKSSKTKHGVSITAYGNQYFGLWSTYPKLANFVCVEPWWGIADAEGSTGFIKEKQDISRLACGDDFKARFKIKFY